MNATFDPFYYQYGYGYGHYPYGYYPKGKYDKANETLNETELAMQEQVQTTD